MKLNIARPNIESSGFVEEQFFSIKDQGMIFDILRSKMYSNPILAICREISCNARDAHREVGTPEVPITIVLPNRLDYSYRVKDLGPGISPDRMSNIFIQYTASTKREDNLQTGGFGLGCKTPFSYSDTFNVITVHKGIKYQYTCFIDETKVGKIVLHQQEATQEPNGTEIVVPVDPSDALLFNQWTEAACRYWEVKPIIKGSTLNWAKTETILQGKDWSIIQESGTNHYQAVKAIIDGIEYPLSLEALSTYTDQLDMIHSMTGIMLLYFGVGELSLSANREQVYLDEPTKKQINDRLQRVYQEIHKIVDTNIDNFPDLWQATLYYRNQLAGTFSNLGFLGKLQWKGIELKKGGDSLGCAIFNFSKGKVLRRGGFNPEQIGRIRLSYLHFSPDYELYINDLPVKEPTPKHVKKAFEDNPSLKNIQVVSPNDKVTEAVLNTKYHFDKLMPKRLSSITKVSKRSSTPASSRLIVFKFDSLNHAYRQVSYASIDGDTNDKVICILNKTDYPAIARLPALKNKQRIDLATISALAKRDPNVSFYGVDQDAPQKRIQEEFDDFEALDDYLDRQVVNNASLNYTEIKYALTNQYKVQEYLIRQLKTFDRLIKDKNSPFLKLIHLHQKIKNINSGDTSLLPVYEAVKGAITDAQINKFLAGNPDNNLDHLDKEYELKYPLLVDYNSYRLNDNIKHIVQYVNLIDTHG